MDLKGSIKSILPSNTKHISNAYRILDNKNYRSELLKLYQQIENDEDNNLEAAELSFQNYLKRILEKEKDIKYSGRLDLEIRKGLRNIIQQLESTAQQKTL